VGSGLAADGEEAVCGSPRVVIMDSAGIDIKAMGAMEKKINDIKEEMRKDLKEFEDEKKLTVKPLERSHYLTWIQDIQKRQRGGEIALE
jgi:hypothetical protein